MNALKKHLFKVRFLFRFTIQFLFYKLFAKQLFLKIILLFDNKKQVDKLFSAFGSEVKFLL